MFSSLFKLFKSKSENAPNTNETLPENTQPETSEKLAPETEVVPENAAPETEKQLESETATKTIEAKQDDNIAVSEAVEPSTENELPAETTSQVESEMAAQAEMPTESETVSETSAEVQPETNVAAETVEVVEEIIQIETKSDIETSWTFGGKPTPPSENASDAAETSPQNETDTTAETNWTYGGAKLHEEHNTIQIDPSKLTPQTKALLDEVLEKLPEKSAALVGKLDADTSETTAAEPQTESWASSVVHQAEDWAEGMAHAIADKADELEMRGEILLDEAVEAVKEAGHKIEELAHAIADKADELEMRGEIVAHEAVQAVKESIETLEHAVVDEIPTPELLPENEAETEIAPPPAAEAATEVDENQHDTLPEKNIQPAENHVANLNDVPIVAAAAATVLANDDDDDAEPELSWTARLARGLSKSRNHMAKSLAGVFGGGKIDEDLYEELETVLITSDMGIEATEHLMNEVRKRVSLKGLKDGNELRQALKDAVYDLLKPLEQPLVLPENGKPFVIMMAGINGAGKTTSIGKLAKYFQAQGKSVMLAAGDTFRAAAREQLQEWGKRNNVTVISQTKGDSAAVCFDAVESAKAKGIDIVLADTAGRLPTQLHLMEEIAKVKRVLQKAMPDAPHEIMLVLDANIGQNAINQVIAFDDALGVTGLIVTKLDGTAKGGVLAALASNRAIPVRYIGVGESIDDLRPFKARDFVDALLDEHKD